MDWPAVRTVTAGRRSVLAGLRPVVPGGGRTFLAEVAWIAGVGRTVVVYWRRRYPGFGRGQRLADDASADAVPLSQLARRQAAFGLLADRAIEQVL